MDLFFIVPYIILLIAGVTVPSDGNHGVLNIKSLAFLSTVGVLTIYFIRRKRFNREQLNYFAFFCFAMAFLCIWFLVGMIDDLENAISRFDQFKIVFITLFFPMATLYLVSEKLLAPQTILKIAIYATFGYCCAKIILLILTFTNVISVWTLMKSLGVRFMSMNIFGGINRLQTSVDIVTPVIVFFMLMGRRFSLYFSNRFRVLFVSVGLISTLLSFSRFLLAVYFLSLALYCLNLHVKALVQAGLVGLIVLLGAGTAIGWEKVVEVVEKRVFSNETAFSDQVRVNQINAIMHEYDRAPFFGKGLGGYSEEYLRDALILHSYEVQWFAFLMQFGIIGLSFVFCPFILIACLILRGGMTVERTTTFVLFLSWLMAGFTNPFLISLTSGIIYAFFILAAELLKKPFLNDSRDQKRSLHKNSRLLLPIPQPVHE